MSHRPYYAQKHRHWWLWFLLAVIIALTWYHLSVFNPNKISEESILKDKTFNVEVEEITAPTGDIKAYLMRDSSNPIVSLSFIFADSGAAYEPASQKGLANISAQMLTEGAGKFSSAEFKEELQNYAIDIDFDVDKDDFSGSLLTLKENLSHAAELLRQTLFEPKLDDAVLKRIQTQATQLLKRRQESPSERLRDAAGRIVFGTHPYAVSVLGTESGIKSVKSADIRRFITQHFGKDNLFVGIAGDISREEAENLLDTVFGNLPTRKAQQQLSTPSIDYSFRSEDVDGNSPQILTSIVAPSVQRLDKNFYPLYIANYIFGGSGLNSRVNQSAREKEGLTYGAYTGLSLLQKSPQLVGGFSTTPQNFDRMREIFIEEWNKMGREGISATELKSAKNYLQSSYNLRFADIGSLSAILASIRRQDLGIDFLQKRNSYIERVTLERVNSAAKQYFSPEKLVIINLGKKK